MRPSFCVQSRSACILGHEVRLMMRLHVHKKEIRYKYLDKLTIWKLKLYIFGDISRPWHRITAIAENHSNRGDREFVIYIHPYPWLAEELKNWRFLIRQHVLHRATLNRPFSISVICMCGKFAILYHESEHYFSYCRYSGILWYHCFMQRLIFHYITHVSVAEFEECCGLRHSRDFP